MLEQVKDVLHRILAGVVLRLADLLGANVFTVDVELVAEDMVDGQCRDTSDWAEFAGERAAADSVRGADQNCAPSKSFKATNAPACCTTGRSSKGRQRSYTGSIAIRSRRWVHRRDKHPAR